MRFKLVEAYLIEDIESMKKYYPNIADDVFMDYIKLDPTYKGGNNAGKYAKWILALANKDALDNIGHVKDILTRFDTEKNNLINKDIMRYKSIDELEDMLNDESSYAEKSHRQQVRDRQKARRDVDITKDARLVFSGDGFDVWVPETYAASCKLGAGTRWCTASTESDYYYNYYKNSFGGDYYILINKSDKDDKYQFHFESFQFMDKDDDSIDIADFFEDKPALKKFFVPLILEALGADEETFSKPIHVSLEEDSIATALAGKNVRESFIRDMIQGYNADWFDYSFSFYEAEYFAENNISDENRDMINEILETKYGVDDPDEVDFKDLADYRDIADAITLAFDLATEDAVFVDSRAIVQSAIEEAFNSIGEFDVQMKGLTTLNINITPEALLQMYMDDGGETEYPTNEKPYDVLIYNRLMLALEDYKLTDYDFSDVGYDPDADLFNEDLDWRLDEILSENA